MYDVVATDDVTELLPRVQVPTLVIQHTGDAHMVDLARDLVARIPKARLVLLDNTLRDDSEKVLPALDDFLGLEAPRTADEVAEPHTHEHPPVAGAFRTILFTDVVSHTEMMRRLGDVAGREVLREHERLTREVLARHDGTEVKTTGDGFMASFASVTAAVECAIALQRAFDAHDWSSALPDASGEDARLNGLSIRVGLNAGEPIAEKGDYFGATVIIAARIADQASGAEILASNVVRELCAGKGFLFADRGESVLRGFEDPVRIFEIRWQE
jgi:class 3 adenylate cyclase